jgi:hypothetical protein
MTPFCVHPAGDTHVAAHRVEAADFHDAALLFVERWLHPQGEDAVTLHVQDETTGEEHCLHLDLAHADAAVRVEPCALERKAA